MRRHAFARPLRFAWVFVAAGCAGPFVVPAHDASRQSPSPRPGPPATGCESCHAAIATEWQSSFHRAAFVDETFQSSLAMEEPKDHAFCNGCHAPAAARAGVAVGVDCIACHGGSPHERAQAAAGSSSCKACHEFTFGDGRPELVQKTVSEHAVSAFASVPCAQCHMAARDGHTDHRFLSGHAPERIAHALEVDVARSRKESSLRFTIRSSAGHAFPTGDMFRRARLVVFAEGARGQIVASAERTFGRTWGGVRGGEHTGARTQLSDTRILGSWQEDVELEAPSAPIVRVRWTLVYERVRRGARSTRDARHPATSSRKASSPGRAESPRRQHKSSGPHAGSGVRPVEVEALVRARAPVPVPGSVRSCPAQASGRLGRTEASRRPAAGAGLPSPWVCCSRG